MIGNPAAYTHARTAIRDTLAMLDVSLLETRLSSIYKRERFRHRSTIAEIATARIAGFGAHGYKLALEGLSRMM